jgi:hypothetical protein
MLLLKEKVLWKFNWFRIETNGGWRFSKIKEISFSLLVDIFIVKIQNGGSIKFKFSSQNHDKGGVVASVH